MKKGTVGLLLKTLPFLGIRFGIYIATAIAAMLWLGLLLLISGAIDSPQVAAILFLLGIAGIFGIVKVVGHFVLYFLKAAHIAVISEYLTTGNMPEKGQVKYGIEKVKSNIGAAASVAVLDILIIGAVRQVIRIFNTIGSFLSIIPGAAFIIRLFNLIVETACNYIDECILGYIFVNKENNPEVNTWKASADGIVLYAQNWKAIGIGAVKTVLMLWVLKIILYIVSFTLFASSLDMGFFGFLFIALVVWALNKAIIDPLATVNMAKAYFAAIEQNPVPAVDLYEKVANASSKFRKILDNAGSSAGGMAQPTNI